MSNFYISYPQGPTLETPPTHPANDSMWIILPIPKGMNDSFFIRWPFSSRNLDGWNSSGFSQMLGSLCTDHRLGTITLPLGIVYPWSTLIKAETEMWQVARRKHEENASKKTTRECHKNLYGSLAVGCKCSKSWGQRWSLLPWLSQNHTSLSSWKDTKLQQQLLQREGSSNCQKCTLQHPNAVTQFSPVSLLSQSPTTVKG